MDIKASSADRAESDVDIERPVAMVENPESILPANAIVTLKALVAAPWHLKTEIIKPDTEACSSVEGEQSRSTANDSV
ncbi:hypothetical protein [Paracoccus sp. (in: a-proteobacteria)]|uniref:hypothetical protein n=1 Tax=Paracoccus sp. TaxID=267 RepID=UPI00396C49D3